MVLLPGSSVYRTVYLLTPCSCLCLRFLLPVSVPRTALMPIYVLDSLLTPYIGLLQCLSPYLVLWFLARIYCPAISASDSLYSWLYLGLFGRPGPHQFANSVQDK